MQKKILATAVSLSLLSFAFPALAETTPSNTQVSCVASAVNAREQALSAGIAAYTQAVSAAYSARASALQQAYSLAAGGGAIKSAVKTAWTNFGVAMKSARKTWQSTKSSNWSKFKTAVRACKAPGVVNDSGYSAMEASGQ